MKMSLTAIMAAGLMLAVLPTISQAATHSQAIGQTQAKLGVSPLLEAHAKPALIRVALRRYKRHYHRRNGIGRHHRNDRVRSYRRNRYERTPGHYTFRDFPAWAARAFEPARTR